MPSGSQQWETQVSWKQDVESQYRQLKTLHSTIFDLYPRLTMRREGVKMIMDRGRDEIGSESYYVF